MGKYIKIEVIVVAHIGIIIAAAVLSFNLAFLLQKRLGLMVIVYLAALVILAHCCSPLQGFAYGGLIGVCTVVPQLHFLWKMLGSKALGLWLMLISYQVVFLGVASFIAHWNRPASIFLIPVLWLALEYASCELSPMRFAWLTPGGVHPSLPTKNNLGLYGISVWWILVTSAGTACSLHLSIPVEIASVVLAFLLSVINVKVRNRLPGTLRVIGVQMERELNPDGSPAFLFIDSVIARLNHALESLQAPKQQDSSFELVMAPEYTLKGDPPAEIRDWCKEHHKHLIIGGKRELADGSFRNTAFVISADGEVVFEQAKAVPIPVLNDGLPAPVQKPWTMPNDRKAGLCICYDLQFITVTDELVRLGAEVIFVIAMDQAKWGRYEHYLHELVCQRVASRYGIDVVRVVSSGYSQHVSGDDGSITEAVDGIIDCTIKFGAQRMPRDSAFSRFFDPIPRANRH